MEAGEFGTVRDLAVAVWLAERHASRPLRLAYLAPEVLKRLIDGREGPAATVLDLSDCATLPWAEQAGRVFEGGNNLQNTDSAKKTRLFQNIR
jgi:hypothetical protein